MYQLGRTYPCALGRSCPQGGEVRFTDQGQIFQGKVYHTFCCIAVRVQARKLKSRFDRRKSEGRVR